MLSLKSIPLLSFLFVASAAALTTTAACSSSSGGTADTTDGGQDAAKDAKPTPVDSGDDDAGDAVCPPSGTISASDIEQAVDWKGPGAPQSACTQENIDALKTLFNTGNGSAKYSDIKTALGGTCTACVFTSFAAANWSVFIEDDAGTVDNSTFSCFAQNDGNGCGKAAFEFTACLNIACNTDDCGSQTAADACRSKAATTTCKALNTAVSTACKNLQADINACDNVYQAIVASCAGGPDAGLDASAN